MPLVNLPDFCKHFKLCYHYDEPRQAHAISRVVYLDNLHRTETEVWEELSSYFRLNNKPRDASLTSAFKDIPKIADIFHFEGLWRNALRSLKQNPNDRDRWARLAALATLRVEGCV